MRAVTCSQRCLITTENWARKRLLRPTKHTNAAANGKHLSSLHRQKVLLLGVMFTSDGKQITQTGEANANVVLRELYRFVVTKREFSNAAELWVIESVSVPILIYSHESEVMTARVQFQVQATKMGRVHAATLGDNVCRAMKLVKPWMLSHFSEWRNPIPR